MANRTETLLSVKYLSPFVEVEIERLVPHPLNKELFPMIDIDAIAESIRQHGVIEPIVIRPKASFEEMQKFLDSDANTCLKHFKLFFICAGHRRVEALKKLGHKTVSARIIIPLFKGADELILIHENLNQRILSPGTVLKATQIERRLTPIEVLLSELPEEIREYYKKGFVSDRFIRLLASNDDSSDNSSYEEIIDTLEKIKRLGFEGKVSSPEELEGLKQKLAEKEDEIKEILKEKEKVDREKKKLEKEKNVLENSIRRLNEAVRLREEKLQRLNETLSSLKAELNQLQQQVSLKPSPELEEKIRKSKQKIRETSSKLRLKEEEIKQFKAKLEEEREKYKALKEEMQRIIERETERRIEEIKQEFQNILTETRKQLEKEREEKKRLLKELKEIETLSSRKKDSSYASGKPSKMITPEERTVLGVIAQINSFALFLVENEDVLRNVRDVNPSLFKETIIKLNDLAKGIQGLTLEIGKDVLEKKL